MKVAGLARLSGCPSEVYPEYGFLFIVIPASLAALVLAIKAAFPRLKPARGPAANDYVVSAQRSLPRAYYGIHLAHQQRLRLMSAMGRKLTLAIG